jgi:hypothetical protein
MALPSTDKRTCEHAIKWIKENFPYVTKGFIEAYTWVDWDAYDYDCTSVVWHEYEDSDSRFLYWGHKPDRYDTIVPFPSYDDIELGEL